MSVSRAVASGALFLVLLAGSGSSRGSDHPSSTNPAGGPGSRIETLRVTSTGGVTLVGELFIPDGTGPFPAVILTHGAERGERSLPGYRQWAERFRSRGVAALIFAKRGVGESGGEYVEAPDLSIPADDVLAWFRLLAKHGAIRHDRVGVLGWSQGGWVGPLAASRSSEIAFVISISGPGVSPLEQNLFDETNQFRDSGASPERVRAYERVLRLVWTYLATGRDSAQAQEAWDAVAREPWFRADYDGPPMGDRAQVLKHPRLRFFVVHSTFDPVPVLEKLRVPMLAVFGSADRITPVEASVAAIERALQKSGHSRLTVRVFEGAGHGISIRDENGERLPAPGFEDLVLGWTLEQVAGARP